MQGEVKQLGMSVTKPSRQYKSRRRVRFSATTGNSEKATEIVSIHSIIKKTGDALGKERLLFTVRGESRSSGLAGHGGREDVSCGQRRSQSIGDRS